MSTQDNANDNTRATTGCTACDNRKQHDEETWKNHPGEGRCGSSKLDGSIGKKKVEGGFTVIEIVITVAILFIVSLWLLGVATDDRTARNRALLQADGISDVTWTGYDWFTCSDSDTFHDGFRGKKNGVQVSGVVCSGLMKGATIRYTGVGK